MKWENSVKKIAFVVASIGYQPVEYGVPYQILDSDGIKILTVSDKAGVAQAKDSSTTVVDLTLEQLNPVDFDGVYVIGGPGAMLYLNTPRMHDILRQMQILKKSYGAICISPRILAQAGVLKEKNATGWNDDNNLAQIFKQHDVNYVHQDVVVDGNIVTATGPGAAQEFALAILKIMKPE